ncbi:MAG: response regulator transcription factor [Oscillospiraceae bacterium]|nr:response regulator transcription factor [Oscillospiraceae bacterium]
MLVRLLYAEDEPALSEAVVDHLTYHKYIVDAVYNGVDAYDHAMCGTYDGIILDIMMPGRDGLEVLSELRRNGCRTPVLLLTAKTQVEDRICGLDAGADDYLPKPFDMRELLARIRAMLRRREEFHPDVLTFGDLKLNMQSGEIFVGEMAILLPKQEYRLMEQLMLNCKMYLSTEELLVKAWGYNTETDLGSVWLYISYLRKRLSAAGSKVEIVSRRNIGYKLEMMP